MFADIPDFLALAIFIVSAFGLTGFVATVRSLQRLAAEARNLREGLRAFSKLDGADKTWHEGPKAWLSKQPIEPDSHFGDYTRAVWGGWLHGRIPSLDELRSMSRRRELSSLANGISKGVVALLLIVGIAGTLLAIKPILGGFEISVSAMGETEDAALSAEKVTLMIHRLGTSFLPSLIALVATVLVSVTRGLYLQRSSRLSHDLDMFALEELFPRFRAPSITQDFQEIHVGFIRLSDQMQRRDDRFGESVERLAEVVAGLEKVAPALRDATKKLQSAKKEFISSANTGIEDLQSIAESQIKSLRSTVETSGTEIRNNVSECETSFLRTTAACELGIKEATTSGETSIRKAIADGEDSIRLALDVASSVVTSVVEAGSEQISKAMESSARSFRGSADRISRGVGQIEKSNQSLQEGVLNSLKRNEEGIEMAISQQDSRIVMLLDSAGEKFTRALEESNKGFTEVTKSANRLETISRNIVGDFESLTELLRSRERFWRAVKKRTKLDVLLEKIFGRNIAADD